MKPIDFAEANRTYSSPSGEEHRVSELRAHHDGEQVVSLWRPTWRERLSILVFGRVWLHLLAERPQPAALSGRRTVFEPAVPRRRRLRGLLALAALLTLAVIGPLLILLAACSPAHSQQHPLLAEVRGLVDSAHAAMPPTCRDAPTWTVAWHLECLGEPRGNLPCIHSECRRVVALSYGVPALDWQVDTLALGGLAHTVLRQRHPGAAERLKLLVTRYECEVESGGTFDGQRCHPGDVPPPPPPPTDPPVDPPPPAEPPPVDPPPPGYACASSAEVAELRAALQAMHEREWGALWALGEHATRAERRDTPPAGYAPAPPRDTAAKWLDLGLGLADGLAGIGPHGSANRALVRALGGAPRELLLDVGQRFVVAYRRVAHGREWPGGEE